MEANRAGRKSRQPPSVFAIDPDPASDDYDEDEEEDEDEEDDEDDEDDDNGEKWYVGVRWRGCIRIPAGA